MWLDGFIWVVVNSIVGERMNNVVIIFEGEKPDVCESVEVGNYGMVRKWNQHSTAQVIGERVSDALYNGTLDINEIFVCLLNNVVLPEQTTGRVQGFVANPLFTAKVDQQGRISILKRYRDKVGIQTGDLVDVFDMKKVE